ncbi:type II toxin-antitoxin system VapC family toxin [Weissella confusa]|uniref:type II toxin-antitoxin system VapC family toxin n=1 Tax=Weissella confusa TaxID=1583 RepID=UPI00223ADE82|nr:PIN domain-containing protein [Weissella confusa]MCT0041415.1 type II toxin-antitoxin system VapC family toxin [Weissella confusa]MCT8393195.1 type II toxin-antitoxin system VapC family toxin [Weissella confusa]
MISNTNEIVPTVKNILIDETISSTKPVFLDNNFLVYWMPVPGDTETVSAEYNDVLALLISRKIPAFVSSHVFSEYLNKYLRSYYYQHFKELNPYNDTSGDHYKKYFRNKPIYFQVLDQAKDSISEVLTESDLDVTFHEGTDLLINRALKISSDQHLDFTDSILAVLANEYGAAVLSDDNDLQKSRFPFNLTVYTTHPVKQ